MYRGQFQRSWLLRMNEIFIVWYPRANDIERTNGSWPTQILAHVKYTKP
jgi:hypothetical protein